MHLPSLLHRLHTPSTPLLYPAVATLLGTFFGLYGGNVAVAFILLLAAAILLILRRFVACALILCIAAGWFNAELHRPYDIPIKYQKGDWTFSGKIDRSTETETSTVTDVSIDSIGHDMGHMLAVRPMKIQLTIAGFNHRAAIASRIRWTGNLADSHTLHRLAIMDDIRRHARRRGISGSIVIRPEAIESITNEPGALNSLYRLRSRIAEAIYDTSMTPSATEFLSVVLLGDTEMLTADRREAYSSAGLSHILALSGMHVAVIALLISIGLCPLLMMRRRTAVIVTTVTILWLYAAITGFSPSVTRAVIMASVFAGARLLQRRSSPYNSLCLAAMAIVIVDPFALLSYGFQMSFAAVASIVAFAGPLIFVNPRYRLLYHLNTYLTLPIAAMAGIGFIACYYFHTFPLYFIPASVVATVLLPIVCIGGAIATLLNAVHLHGILYTSACFITDTSVNILDRTAQFFSSLPGASLNGIDMPTESLVLFLAAVILLALCLNLHRRVYGYASLMPAFAAIVCCFVRPAYEYRDVHAVIVPDRSFTTLLVRDESSATVYTDATGTDTTLVKQRIQRDFETYLRMTDTEDVTIAKSIDRPSAGVYILSELDSAAFTSAINHQTAGMIHIVISGKVKAKGIRNAPWHLLSGRQHIKVIPSPALRPRMASMVKDLCGKYGIPTSDTLVIRHQSISIKSLGM